MELGDQVSHGCYVRSDAYCVSKYSLLECVAVYNGGHPQSKSVTIQWTVPPVNIMPIIDDKDAKYAAVNDTFTLDCNVNIEIGVLVFVDWIVPDHVDPSRVTKGVKIHVLQFVNEIFQETP